jgi:hypothetical protein
LDFPPHKDSSKRKKAIAAQIPVSAMHVNADKIYFIMTKRLKKILIIAIAVVVAAALIWGYFSGSIDRLITRDLAVTSEKFLSAVRTDDYDTAFALCSQAFKAELGSVDALHDAIYGRDAIPTEWQLDLFRMDGNLGEVEGTGMLTRGRRAVINLALSRENRQWLISGFLIEEL